MFLSLYIYIYVTTRYNALPSCSHGGVGADAACSWRRQHESMPQHAAACGKALQAEDQQSDAKRGGAVSTTIIFFRAGRPGSNIGNSTVKLVKLCSPQHKEIYTIYINDKKDI